MSDNQMNERCQINNDMRSNLDIKIKTSRLAIFSFCLAVSQIFLGKLFAFSDLALTNPIMLGLIFEKFLPFAIIVFAILSLIMIKKANGLLQGKLLAIIAIIIALFFALIPPIMVRAKFFQKEYQCRQKMILLGKALSEYAADHSDNMPGSSGWNDLLIEYLEPNSLPYLCPGAPVPINSSCYALNINISYLKYSELPRDIVVLFESKPDWNQSGGNELLEISNHNYKNRQKCTVLFGDGRVESLDADKVKRLRWVK